jgi:hypothetical protein
MTQQGVLWPALYQGEGSRIRKWLYGSVLIRDWDAAGSTNMNDIVVFLANGNLNPALLQPVSQGGYGFYDVGSITENGVEFGPKFTVDQVKIWQSRKSQRTDKTEDDEEVTFSCAESTPLIDYLWYDLPIGFTGVPTFPAIGAANYAVTMPLYSDIVHRQLLIIGVDGSINANGQPEYIVELRPRVELSKKAKKQWAAKQVDVTELSYYCHVDPFSGYDRKTLRGGIVWTDEGGPVTLPIYSSVASPPTSNTASILSPTISRTPSGSGGTFAAGTYYWVLTATNANGETLRSNEVSATLSGTTSSVTINWSQITGATGYKLYRGTAAGAENALITTIGSGATITYTDTGSAGSGGAPPLASTAVINAPASLVSTPSTVNGNLAAQQYFWEVTAKTAAGETTASNEVNSTFTTATSSTALSWSSVTGATGYNVYRGVATGGENVLVGSASTNSFTDSGSVVTATATGSGNFSLVFNQPNSGNGPYVYTVTVSNNNGVSYAPATLTSTTTSAAGVVTILGSGLTATNVDNFLVTATAANGNAATYPVSNSITVT